jgi:hypothetical protein
MTSNIKYVGMDVHKEHADCRAFLAWRRSDNRRKQKGNVSEPRR